MVTTKEPRFRQTIIYESINSSLIRKAIFRGVNINNIHAILDIGCGNAPEILTIENETTLGGIIVGIDITYHPSWKISAKRSGVNFVVASAHNLPFKPDVFDFVLIKDVLHHIPKNTAGVIKEAFTSVGNSGTLRVIEANRYNVSPILVFKNDNSHDHFTIEQLKILKERLLFDEIYGYELLPSFSHSKKDFPWNAFVTFIWLLTGWVATKRLVFLYLQAMLVFFPNNLTYYVLSKKKEVDTH